MWRKQEEPKVNSPEVREQPRVEQSAPASVVAAVPTTPGIIMREATPPAGHLTSTLVIKGEITGREDLYIDGEVQGKIRIEEGRVTIGPNGRVTADVDAREIVVRGRVKGNLHARERVQIGQTGCANGDVVTQRISIEDGAEMHGRVEIVRVEEPKKPQVEPAHDQKKPAAVVPVAASPVVASPVVASSSVAPKKELSEPVTAPARESAPVA